MLRYQSHMAYKPIRFTTSLRLTTRIASWNESKEAGRVKREKAQQSTNTATVNIGQCIGHNSLKYMKKKNDKIKKASRSKLKFTENDIAPAMKTGHKEFTLVQAKAWCKQTTSPWLNQWCPKVPCLVTAQTQSKWHTRLILGLSSGVCAPEFIMKLYLFTTAQKSFRWKRKTTYLMTLFALINSTNRLDITNRQLASNISRKTSGKRWPCWVKHRGTTCATRTGEGSHERQEHVVQYKILLGNPYRHRKHRTDRTFKPLQ